MYGTLFIQCSQLILAGYVHLKTKMGHNTACKTFHSSCQYIESCKLIPMIYKLNEYFENRSEDFKDIPIILPVKFLLLSLDDPMEFEFYMISAFESAAKCDVLIRFVIHVLAFQFAPQPQVLRAEFLKANSKITHAFHQQHPHSIRSHKIHFPV